MDDITVMDGVCEEIIKQGKFTKLGNVNQK